MSETSENDKTAVRCTGLLAAGDALLRALAATQEGIGCGCGGDYGLCNRCSKADTEAEEAAEAWEAAKKAANDKVSYHADNAGGAHGKDTNDK